MSKCVQKPEKQKGKWIDGTFYPEEFLKIWDTCYNKQEKEGENYE